MFVYVEKPNSAARARQLKRARNAGSMVTHASFTRVRETIRTIIFQLKLGEVRRDEAEEAGRGWNACICAFAGVEHVARRNLVASDNASQWSALGAQDSKRVP